MPASLEATHTPLETSDRKEASPADRGASASQWSAAGGDLAIALGSFAAVVITAGASLAEGERRDWICFISAGIAFPLLIVLFNLRPWDSRHRSRLVVVSFTIATLASAYLSINGGLIPIAALVIAMAAFRRFTGIRMPRPAPTEWVLLAACWYAAATSIWWTGGLPQTLTVCFTTLVAAGFVTALFGEPPTSRGRGIASTAAAIGAPAVLAFLSLRGDAFSDWGVFHHWSFLAGPAELLRRGGWLLWDTPSQYGFLSMITLAAFPSPDRFQALYSLNVFLLFFASVFAWYLLQRLRPDAIGRLIALALTASAFFLISGSARELTGPMLFPSVGPFRFLWVYALIAVPLWNFLDEGRRTSLALRLGGVTWVLAVLWSFESAVYAMTIWIPTAVCMALHLLHRSTPAQQSRARVILLALTGPLLLGLVVAGISVFYQVRLGYLPDFRGFWEFSAVYATSYGTLPAGAVEPWIALGLVLAIGAAVAAPCIREREFLALSTLVAGWGAMWSTASYYVGRSHPNNATNLLPIAITVIACFLLVSHKRGSGERWILRAASIPLLAFIIVAPLLNRKAAWKAVVSSKHGFVPNVAARLPFPDPALRPLLEKAAVGPDDPMLFLGATAAPLTFDRGRPTVRDPIIPAIPSILLDALPEPRRREYIRRHLLRSPASNGWLLRPRGYADARLGLNERSFRTIEKQDRVILEEVMQVYRAVEIYRSSRWELARLERRR